MECFEPVDSTKVAECDSGSQNVDQIELLDVMVLKTCGQLVYDLFDRFGNDDATSTGCDNHSDTISSTATADNYSGSSNSSMGYTYHDELMARAFDRLYDVMSQDLEKVNPCQMQPKLLLYHKLKNVVRHHQLHEINR